MLTLTAAGSGIVDGVGDPLAANASDTWTTDAQPPTVDIVDVADPRNSAVGQLYDRLREAISGLDLSDFEPDSQRRRQPPDRQPVADRADNITWTLGGLSGLTAGSRRACWLA